MPKSRINALPRPHLKQRFFTRVANFCFFFERAMTDVFAIVKNDALRAGQYHVFYFQNPIRKLEEPVLSLPKDPKREKRIGPEPIEELCPILAD